jgi:hypothetical protein
VVGGAAKPRLRTCIEPMLALTPSMVEITDEVGARWPAAQPARKTSAASEASSAHRGLGAAGLAGLTAHTLAARSQQLMAARGALAGRSPSPRVAAATAACGRPARQSLVIS